MEHYELAQWVDFVRGLSPDPERHAMQEHLASCRSCAKSQDLLRKLATAAIVEREYEVPAYALENAHTIAALQPPEEVTLTHLVASLVFDSFNQPDAVGFRAEQQELTRQALYHAEDVCIDVRIEQERDSGVICLIGQLNDRRDPRRGLAGVPVVLFAGNRIIAHTVSSVAGEFQMYYRHKRNMRLHLLVNDRLSDIEVPLNDAGQV